MSNRLIFRTEFPDIHWLKRQIKLAFSASNEHKGWPTCILNVPTQGIYRDDIKGPLSIFLNVRGKSLVQVDGRTVTVGDQCFFLSNSDQIYNLQVADQQAETLNLHISDQLVQGVMQSLNQKAEKLLDQALLQTKPMPAFYNKLYYRDRTLNQMLSRIKDIGQSGGQSMELEELLFALVSHIFSGQKRLDQQLDQLPALKKSTREALIKRLFHATDYMYSFFDRPINLDELARESCLSKFYFLRLFKQLYQQTPYQFLTRLRLQKSESLLISTPQTVSEIAWQVGLENSSSFSRLFYKHKGMYPSQFRAVYGK